MTTGKLKHKMMTAAHSMCFLKNEKIQRNFKINSATYEMLRKGHAEAMSLLMKGVPKSEEHKRNISNSLKGLEKSEEHRKKLSIAQTERMKDENYANPWAGERGSELSSKLNLERVANGTNPWAGERGSELSRRICKDQLEKGIHPFQGEHGKELAIRRNKKAIEDGTHINCKTFTCPHCNLTGKGPNMLRWHFDKCKKKDTTLLDF